MVTERTQQMKDAISAMTQLPVGKYYQEAADQLLQSVEEMIDSAVASLTKSVVSFDSYLMAARKHTLYMTHAVSESVQNITSHPSIKYWTNQLDVSPYIQAASDKVSSLRMPEEYSAAIYRASSKANQVLADFMDAEPLRQFRSASNEIYQQGVWAYNYWQTEENLKKHLENIATHLKEIVEEELALYTRHFRFMQKSHVTVWDPEHGEIQAEISLPVAMETLDSMPDMTPLMDQYNEVVNSVPNMDTVKYFYDNYVPQSAWWSNNETSSSTDQKQLMDELEDFTPNSKRVLRRKKANYRNRKLVAAM